MSEVGPRRPPQDQSSGSGHTVTTSRHPYITDPIASKHVCFYKSGDPQFSGLRMAINSRTFKTFDALLDSLSKKVPLPFGVRNITTPRGVHAVHTLDELEDGKAYICSDQRKVKPINMAAASKKLPPWYHARPMSARRRAFQLAKQNPGRPMRKKKPVTVRTPKRLMVFRNGDPSVKHNMMLQKRTTPTFEALLDYVSELMHFPVVKLHTPDGRRVDGLPALILCSGIVVAAGREAFKSGNYKTQRSSAPTWLPARRMASKRLKQPAPRKKKSVSSSKSHLFSSSSERYFVNQIHHSVAGSQCDLPSNNTGSVVLEAGHFLESVAETDADTYNGHEGADNCMPGDDDIEKSFRVNQDGSMTVEMKVRLTIKEEETIHWTTTLTRSSVASQLSVAESELEIRSPESNALPPTQPNAMGTINGYNAKKDDHDDEDDMSPEASGPTSVEGDDEDNSKIHVSEVSLRRAPTPGPRRSRQKQASLENINTPSGDEIQENIVGSYSYRETTKNGEVKEEYCMVRQCSSRPVPKPRRVGSMDINNYNKTQSTFKSGAAEILQIQNSEEEVRESVMQIYEQQTCQDNFLANSQYSVQGVSTYGLMYGRPATSETARFSSSNDLEMELERLSTASESISVRRADQSLSSDFTIPTFKAGGSVLRNRVLNVHKTSLSKPTKDNETPKLVSEESKENSTTKAVKKVKKRFSKPKLRKYQVRKSTTPDKRRKESSANSPENNKRVKTGGFSRNASIRKIYGPKPARSLMKNKLKGKEIKLNIENPKELSVKELNVSENGNGTSVSVKKKLLHVSFPTEAQGKGTLKRQRSVHEERRIAKECHDLSLPALLSSSSNINEYVENWLEKALPTVYPDPVEETQNVETPTMSQVETEGDLVPDVSEINCEMDIEEDESCFLKEKTQIPSSPSLVTAAFPNRTFENIATQTNLTMENTTLPCPSDPSLQKTPLHIDTIQERLPTNPSAENPPLSNGFSVFPPAIISVEKPSPSDSPSLEQTSIPIKISVEKLPIPNDLSLENTSVPNSSLKENIPVSNCLSPEKTPLPAKTQTEKTPLPAKTQTEKTPLSNKVSDGSSVASSPSYLMCSSPSSLGDEEQPLSSSPSSDEAPSTTGHAFEKTLFNHSTLKEPPSPKLATKKTRLLSNLSLEKQLSFRKAAAEKSSISSDPTVEKVLVDKAPISNGLSSDKTSHPAKTLISNNVLNEASLASSPSCFISTSPTNRTSDERALSISPPSEEDLSPTGHVLEKTTLFNHSTLRETSSPKLPTKKTRLISNVSLEKQLSLRRLSVNKSSLSSNPTLEKAQLSNPVQITADKTQLPNSHSLEETSPPNKSSLPSDSTSENTQLSSSPQQGRTPLPRHISLKTQLHNNFSPERTNLPTLMTRNKSAPSNLSSEKIPVPSNRTLKNRLSPYSQTLEIVSPPTRLKAKKKPVSRNHSLAIEPSPVSPTLKRTPLPRKSRQTPLSPKSTPVHLNSSMKKTPTPPSPALVNHEETNGDDNLSNSDQGDSTKVTAEEPLTKAQIPSYREQLPPQPDMKPVLEKLCFSIRSIRQITHNNRPSCLEKSNSLPDFSSHVASTFGSSSKALLAFLSVITLKESFTNWNIPELNANSVSCAEALKMIESLREIANIEDAEELKANLSDLQKSTSSQLLQSWKGFQELNDKVRSRSSALNSSEHDLLFETRPVEDYNIKEKALDIDELINELDVPEKVKEALAALSTGVSMSMDGNEINIYKKANEKVESSPEGRLNANSTEVPKEEAEKDHVLNKEATVDVKSIIKTFTNIHHPKEVAENTVSQIPESPSSRQEQYFSSKEHSFKEDYICHGNRQAANKEGAELEQDNWEEEEAKFTYKQVNHDEEQTSSEIEQAYSLVLHDGYLDKPACSVEAREKDGDIQAGYVEEEESLKKEQEYYIENPPSHVGQEVTSMELQVSCKESVEKDQASSEEEQKCHVEDQISHVESESKCVEEKWLKEEQQCHIDDQPSYCGLQVSREERESTPEEQASSEEEFECHIGQNQSTPKEDQASSDEELERHVASKPTHEEPEVKCTDVKVSSEENMSSLKEEQASLEEELDCHIENQPSHEEKGVKCTGVKVSSEENMSSFEEDQASLEEELECHIENQPSHEEKGVKCIEMQVSREEREYTPEDDRASLDEEEENRADNLPNANAHINVKDEQTHLWMKQTTEKEIVSTVIEMKPSLVKQHSSDDRMDKDSGKDSEQHVSFEQQSDTVEEANVEDNRRGTEKKQVRCEEKLPSSEAEHVGVKDEPYTEDESYAEYEESFVEKQPFEEDTNYEMTEAKTTSRFEEPLPSVAERVKLLDKKIADVGPGDCVPIEENRWLLRESVIRKSVSEPINIYKNTSALTEDECKDAKEDVPYSLFGHTDREDMVKTVKPFVAKCTYFNLPHGCDSDPYQDDLSSVSKGSAMGDVSKDSKDNAEEPKLWAEKNGTLPDFSPTDFKMPDNKVHPLIEGPGGGKVVVVQPGKGQSGKGQTDVKKIPQEPDALEMLYFSCGQHCPIL
ncbi:uro-adherence factor A-like [Oncorhynchus clarkii lewisi]|uniref:uro-adherence factor A-like n=1 Tax=Oncorhynchus clarkii lewisi TaxID=490388 RepID=UPI0039B82272